MKKKLFGIIAIVGFFIAIGSLGSLERETITFLEGIIQIFIGLFAFGGGLYFGDFLDI